MSRCSLLTLLCFLLLPPAATALETGSFRHLGAESGLAQTNINGLFQDEFGRLWIGARDGVKIYNGNSVEPVSPLGVNNWINSSLVPTICGDKRGHVFINTDFVIIEYDLATDRKRPIFRQHNTISAPSIAFTYADDALWMGLMDTLFTYKEQKVERYALLENPAATITSLHKPAGGPLYVGTKAHGLWAFDSASRSRPVLPPCSEVIAIASDSRGCVWVGTFSQGLYRIGPGGEVRNYRHGELSGNYIRAVCEDTEGNIWIGTMNGVDILSPEGGISHVGLKEAGASGLSHSSVWVIMRDEQGTMWVGTYYGGVDYCNPKANIFRFTDLGLGRYPVVSKIVEGGQGELYLATEGSGLVRLDPASGQKKVFPMDAGPELHYNIKSLYFNDDGILWIGTHLGGVCRYDTHTGRFRYFKIDSNNWRSESVIALVEKNGILFIGTLAGVYYMDLKNYEVKKTYVLENSIFSVDAMIIDREGKLWIAGNSLCCYDPQTNYVRDFKRELAEVTSADDITATALAETSDGRIAIATAGFGIILYDPRSDEFTCYNSDNSSLKNDYLGSICQDPEGNLLAGSSMGLLWLDLQTGACRNYEASGGFPLQSMLPGCILQLADGRIVMGGMDGIATLDPKQLSAGDLDFRMWLSSLMVNNRVIKTGDNSAILSRSLPLTRSVRLNSSENNIAVEVGDDNFAHLGQVEYEYRLSGFDTEWIPLRKGAAIRYMNLPYGDYTLNVRALGAGGRQAAVTTLGIEVLAPLYARWWAYLLYALLTLSAAAWVIHFYRSRLLLRNSLELERQDKLLREEVNQAKLRFFANVSHELKTPLTLIIGQIEMLLLSSGITSGVHKSLSEIHKGGIKMSRLINELLDFMKYDQGMFRLKVKKGDLVAFVRETYLAFTSFAELKRIDFGMESDQPQAMVWFDPAQMLKVLNNLLSNAFKYTPEGGKISIRIEITPETVTITVGDNGIGIPLPMQEKIFERFYQADNQVNSAFDQTGTGIGLSLTRNIVESHRGTLRVQSSPGLGSLFIAELPADDRVIQDNPAVEIAPDEEPGAGEIPFSDIEDRKFIDQITEQHTALFANDSTLLVVEDDAKLRDLLVRIFDPMFRILEATGGEEGLRIARELSPDLVISDIMMPGMPGNELCVRLKTDFDTCHIPVVLLTALGSLEHHLEGLNCGADDYITKPFNVRLLVARCVTLLNNRRLLQEKFSREEQSPAEAVTTNNLDKEFIEKAVRIVEQNIGAGSVDVGLLCAEMGISRTKLFLKMKGILGQTPHEFIQNIKLKVAARMLREHPEMNISDITYHLGFSSLNYFGKYFKNYFDLSPSAYRKQFEKDAE